MDFSTLNAQRPPPSFEAACDIHFHNATVWANFWANSAVKYDVTITPETDTEAPVYLIPVDGIRSQEPNVNAILEQQPKLTKINMGFLKESNETPQLKASKSPQMFQEHIEKAGTILKEMHLAESVCWNHIAPNSLLSPGVASQIRIQTTSDVDYLFPVVPGDKPFYSKILYRMGDLYFYKFIQTRDPEDLRKSEELARFSLIMAPAQALLRPSILFAYTTRLLEIYSITGVKRALDRAIDCSEELLQLTPGCPKFVALLSALLNRKNSATMEKFYLDRCIGIGEALLQERAEDFSDRGMLHVTLAEALLKQAERTENKGKTDHLMRAIEHAKKSVETAADDAIRNKNLYNLSCVLTTCFEREHDVNHLAQAVQILERVLSSVDTSVIDNLTHARMLSSSATMLDLKSDILKLANNFAQLFAQGGSPEDVTYGMIHHMATCEDESDPHLQRLCSIVNKSLPEARQFYRAMYWPEREIQDAEQVIDLAITRLQEAVSLLPFQHPERAGFAYNLARSFRRRATRFGKTEDEYLAMEACLIALESTDAEVVIQIQVGNIAAELAEKFEDFEAASEFRTNIIRLISEVAPNSLDLDDLQHILRRMNGAATRAAASILQAGGSPGEALRVLEAGRGVIGGYVISSRKEISDLAVKHPEMAKKYDDLRRLASQPIRISNDVFDGKAAMMSKQIAMKNLKDEEEKIRQATELSRFQLALSIEDMRQQAIGVHIISFNVAFLRSDAIIVTEAGIHSIPLPHLRQADVLENMKLLSGPEKITSGADKSLVGEYNSKMLNMLSWLWKVAVKPVLENLDLLQHGGSPVEELPRVIWITSGILSFFPIHAAGIHKKIKKTRTLSTQNTLSHVVSSYASTIQAIAFTKGKSSGEDRSLSARPEVKYPLVVSMPRTPELAGKRYENLSVDQEINAIKTHFPQTEDLLLPSKPEVLTALESADLVHFACHGITSAHNPSEGCLLLQSPDSGVDRLTIRDLITMGYKNRQIAYLSACSTAEHTGEDIADESIHLASAFQLAGFPHVIASLWPADDGAAGQIAESFYEALSQGKTVAVALHFAILEYREKELDCPIEWASFVHFGK